MCMGGGGGAPAAPVYTPPPTPPPVPTPTPAPQPGEEVVSAEEKRKKVQALKYGALSTVKTSGAGVTGAQADLASTAATGELKKKLGA